MLKYQRYVVYLSDKNTGIRPNSYSFNNKRNAICYGGEISNYYNVTIVDLMSDGKWNNKKVVWNT